MARNDGSRTKRWPNVALLLLTVGLCFVVFEYVARRLMPLQPYEIVPDNPKVAPSAFTTHATRMSALLPNFRGSFIHPDYNGEKVVINEFGFRGSPPPVTKEDQALHITVLGDSLAFGLGVDNHETFSVLLEQRLTRTLKRPVRVFNTGVSGYGAGHQNVVLREEYARHLPDLAVVAYYNGNDPEDAHRFSLLDVISFLPAATTRTDRHGSVAAGSFTINGETRRVLTAHPPAAIRFPVLPGAIRPGARLHVGLALNQSSWGKPGADGVRFEVIAERDGKKTTLLDVYIDPNHDPKARGWNDREIDLSTVATRDAAIIFRTSGGPNGSEDFDWAGWVLPHVVYPEVHAVLNGAAMTSAMLLPDYKKYWEHARPPKRGLFSRRFWEQRSSLMRFLFARFDHVAIRFALKPPKAITNYFLISTFDRSMPAYVRLGLDLTVHALSEINSFMRQRGGKVILLLIPAKFQTEPRTISRFMKHAGLDERVFDFTQPHGMLREFCERTGVTCVDLLPELRRRVGRGERVYFPEGHLNRKGHRIAAQRLAAVVEKLRAADSNLTRKLAP